MSKPITIVGKTLTLEACGELPQLEVQVVVEGNPEWLRRAGGYQCTIPAGQHLQSIRLTEQGVHIRSYVGGKNFKVQIVPGSCVVRDMEELA